MVRCKFIQALARGEAALNGMTVQTEDFDAVLDGFHAGPYNGSTASVAWSANATGGLFAQYGTLSTNGSTTMTLIFQA